jgi:hypothetical protein
MLVVHITSHGGTEILLSYSAAVSTTTAATADDGDNNKR